MDKSLNQKHTKWIDVKNIHTIMASVPAYKTILFSDEKTKLIDYLTALENPKSHEKFLNDISDINISLPSDSPLWPGNTPLHVAVMFSASVKHENKDAQLVSQCLKQGALVYIQNQCGATPLHLAFRMEQEQIIVQLVRCLETQSEAVVNLVDDDNLSYLHIACAIKGYSGLARKLLLEKESIKATVNISYKGENLTNVKLGWTPLHVAVDQRQHYLTELLLQRGADICCKDVQGSTVVHHLFGTILTKPLADILFASEHLRDCVNANTGLSHLHVAVWFNDVNSVERLLDTGADIETTVKTISGQDMEKFVGCTPLLMAMILSHMWCVKALIRRGANVLAKKFNDNTSPLFDALSHPYKSPYNVINVNIAKVFVSTFWEDENNRKFLEDNLGLTELHLACYSNDVDKITTLIDQGVNINAKISNNSDFWSGYTPLHVLVYTTFGWTSKSDILQKLLQSGCDIDQQDRTGKTALHLAVVSQTSDSQDIIEILISAGADINILDRSGKSAFSYALGMKRYCKNDYYRRAIIGVIITFTSLTCKMKLAGIEVCEINENYKTALLRNSANAILISQDTSGFCDQLQETEKVIIGRRGLTLRSFLFETGAISTYPLLTPDDRTEVAAFFQSSINDESSLDWKFLRNLQYRKAVARLSLIDPAVNALKDFISSGFPGICVDIILKYLSNSQLKLLIAASQIVD